MSRVPDAAQREFWTPVVTRRSSWLHGIGVAVLSAVVPPNAGGGLLWLLPPALLLLAPVTGRMWSPVESLWLEGAVLAEQRGSATTRVDLSRLRSVERDWMPNRSASLVFTDDASHRIVIGLLDDSTEALRRAVGQRARVLRASTDLYDPKTRRLLLLDK